MHIFKVCVFGNTLLVSMVSDQKKYEAIRSPSTHPCSSQEDPTTAGCNVSGHAEDRKAIEENWHQLTQIDRLTFWEVRNLTKKSN